MSRGTFFRQGGWMIIASVMGGAFMWAVHVVMQKPVEGLPLEALREVLNRFVHEPVSESAYGLFTTLLNIVMLMSIPSTGLQTVFAQQTASAIDEPRERQLRGTVRSVLSATTLIWALTMVIFFVFRTRILRELNISNPAALWLTLLVGLPIVWSPVFGGLLQGRQNFLWLGWTSILAGFGRCLAAFIIVRVMGAGVAGAMLAVLIGAAAPLLLCIWQTYSDWRGARDPVQWKPWLRRVIPLTIGLGATTFMLSADMIVVRSLFPPKETGFYAAAAIIGRALVLFTVPLAAVMFPKVVRSAALAERTDVMAQALAATGLLGAGAALFCTFFPSLPLRLVYAPSYLVIAPLVPWFAWCMLPLTLANVIVNNLLAREKFRVVPWLVIVTLAYGATLLGVANRLATGESLSAFKGIVQILGCFSALLLAVSIYFTWSKK